MKIAKICIFVGVLVAGLVCDLAAVRAQPESGPSSSDGDTASPGDEPTSSEEESSSDDGSIVADDPNSPWSQGVSSEDRRAAREQLREGTRLYMIPLYARAAEQYAAALRKWKHPAIYYNLALTQRNLGKDSDARENFEHALKYGEKPLGAKRFREAQKQLAQVKRLLGRLRVSCRTPGAEVTLDGVTLFIGPGTYEGWVRATSHELTAKKSGYLAEARRVAVAPEQLHDVELKLVTLTEATDASRRWAAWKPWGIIAAGAAVAAAGGGFHALSASRFDSYDNEFSRLPCVTEPNPTFPGCPEEEIPGVLNERLNRARTLQSFAVGGYIAGGSLIATGIVLLYMNRPRPVEREATISPAKGVTVVPAMSSDVFGVLVSVSH